MLTLTKTTEKDAANISSPTTQPIASRREPASSATQPFSLSPTADPKSSSPIQNESVKKLYAVSENLCRCRTSECDYSY